MNESLIYGCVYTAVLLFNCLCVTYLAMAVMRSNMWYNDAQSNHKENRANINEDKHTQWFIYNQNFYKFQNLSLFAICFYKRKIAYFLQWSSLCENFKKAARQDCEMFAFCMGTIFGIQFKDLKTTTTTKTYYAMKMHISGQHLLRARLSTHVLCNLTRL